MSSKRVFEIALPRDSRLQLKHIQLFIEQTNDQYGIPVTFELNKNSLIAYHPEHPNDYCSIEIKLWTEGQYNIIGGALIGQSKQWKKKVYSDSSKANLRTGYWGTKFGLDNSDEFLFRSGVDSLRSVGYDEEKLIAEEEYYQKIVDLIKITFNAQ